MDNDKEPNEAQSPSIDWVSYHQSQQPEIDVSSVVALVRRVGGELATIDQSKVDGSHKPALQIDKAKLINDLQRSSPQQQNVVASPLPVNSQPQQQNVAASPPPVNSQPQQITKPQTYSIPSNISSVDKSSVDVSKIEARLQKLESATKAFRSAKKIKKGTTYSVCSNSMKGQLKDASLVAEFIMSELAKGVKTITIKLHESTDSKSS